MAEIYHTPEGPVSQSLTGNRHGSRTLSGYSKTPSRSRKHTPYHKTPRTRRLASNTENARCHTPQRPGSITAFTDLVSKTWRVYRVTPLYKFSVRPGMLRRYSRLLAAYMQAEARKGVAVDVDAETADAERADAAVFSLRKGFKMNRDDSEAVEIVLKATPKSGGALRVVLQAVLCCVDAPEAAMSAVTPEFCLLPVMLVKGAVGLTSQLLCWLQMEFDCSISTLTFSPVHLSWVVAMWAGVLPDAGGKPVELMYCPPDEVEGMSKVTLDINPQDCQKLWDSLHEGSSDDVTEEEVCCFLKSLEAHFYHYFRINLAAMHLRQIGTSTVFMGSEGKIKFFWKKHIQQVLRYITELAVEPTARTGT